MSYHLAVVVDDAQSHIIITRKVDLAPYTHLQRLLQALLGLPTPDYHHELVCDKAGRHWPSEMMLSVAQLRNNGLDKNGLLVRCQPCQPNIVIISNKEIYSYLHAHIYHYFLKFCILSISGVDLDCKLIYG